MRKVFIVFLLLFLIISLNSMAYDNLLFKPFTANPFEPRIGAMSQPSREKIRLDIGASFDLLGFDILDSSRINLGTDFFTYTRLRSEGNFKFPVETSDYFFGINGSVKHQISEYILSSRVRIAHISSHLVDGLAKDTIFKKLPFVYSREFVDLAVAIETNNIRLYLGNYFVFSKKPKETESFCPYIGFDGSQRINEWLKFQYGVDLKYFSNSSLSESIGRAVSVQAGFLLQSFETTGILLNCYYYDGKSIHGMFYNEKESYFGVGFQVIFY
jgi:hypothetical protein